MESAPDIVIVDRRIDRSELARLVHLFFGDMVKYVVDLERRIAAVVVSFTQMPSNSCWNPAAGRLTCGRQLLSW